MEGNIQETVDVLDGLREARDRVYSLLTLAGASLKEQPGIQASCLCTDVEELETVCYSMITELENSIAIAQALLRENSTMPFETALKLSVEAEEA